MFHLLPVVLLGTALASDPGDPGDVSSSIGVNIHFTGAPARDLDLIRDAGFGWVRMDFVWQAVEREKGSYRFGPYDELLEGLSSRGIRALFILDYSNPLYEPQRSVRTTEGREAFARFAAAAAGRYRGKGVRWEIWNEPNLEGFWKPQPAADDYAALVLATSKAIRAVDPEAKILAPASSGFPWTFLERIFELGVLEAIDEVSVHPYRSSSPETARDDYARLRALIARHIRAGRIPPPIVSGEWGYSTWHHGGKPFSQEVQAAYLVRELLTNIAEGIPVSIWYDWANDGPDPKETEHNFGTVTLDRGPKPAYVAAKTMTSLLGRSRLERRIRAGAEDHLLLFRAGDRRVLAAWTSGRDRLLTLEVPGLDAPVDAIRMAGDAIALEPEGGLLRLPLDGRPLYVTFPAGVRSVGAYGLEAEPHPKGLHVRVLRSGAGTVRTRLDVVHGKETAAAEVELEGDGKGNGVATRAVDVPIDWAADGKATRVAVSLADASGRRLAALPALEVIDLDAFGRPGAGKLAPILDGDGGVEGEARLSHLEVAAGEPFAGAPALRLEYRFGKGWRFVRIPASFAEADGEDAVRAVIAGPAPYSPPTYSVWVKGDGSGNVLRCRVRDAKGETFQPAGVPVSWRGWRRVEMPLDGSEAGSWGGDGKVDWPLRWDTLLLLDSTREGSAGAIEFAGAMIVRSP